MLWFRTLPFVTIAAVLSLGGDGVCHGQSPGFTHYQPYKLDFSPYQRANDQIFQMQAEMAREEGRRRAEATRAGIQQIKTYYANSKSYPSKLDDGWYEVWTTNNLDYCEKGKVWVSANRTVRYYADDFYEVPVSLPSEISAGRCMTQLGKDGNFFDLYFLEVIADPSKRASPPLQPGTVSFWGEYKRPTKVFVDEQYVGAFETYFKTAPACVAEGTLDVNLKPGLHQIKAEANGHRWTTSVTVRANDCTVVQATTKSIR